MGVPELKDRPKVYWYGGRITGDYFEKCKFCEGGLVTNSKGIKEVCMMCWGTGKKKIIFTQPER